MKPAIPISITIVAAFLGAGNTSLNNHLLQCDHYQRPAVVVNDFGAITELTSMIQRVIARIINWMHRASVLIADTSLTSIRLNLPAADPYVSIVLTARMYRDTYMKHQLEPVVLSTMITDSSTMISYIIPWNVHGAFVIGTLGVGTAYASHAFLNYLSPLVTIFLAFSLEDQGADKQAVKAIRASGVMDD